MWNIGIGSCGVVAGGSVVAIFWRNLPKEVPMWYSRPWGQAQLAEVQWLWLILSLVAMTTFFTAITAKWFATRDRVLSSVVSCGGIVATTVGAMALVRIFTLIL
jgi:hypothetical protein